MFTQQQQKKPWIVNDISYYNLKIEHCFKVHSQDYSESTSLKRTFKIWCWHREILVEKGTCSFFYALVPQHGYWWYSILLSSNTTDFDEQHYGAFPPLLKLVSIEEERLQTVLVHHGLAMFQKGIGHSAVLKAWDYYIQEKELITDVEVHIIQWKKLVHLYLDWIIQ